MEKDFDKWNEKKKIIENCNINEELFFHNTEIWWCNIGLNIKSESCGKGADFRRPVLILKRLSSEIFIGVPLTSNKKVGTWFCEYVLDGDINYAMLYQIRLLHKIDYRGNYEN